MNVHERGAVEAALERALVTFFAAPGRLASIERRPSRYATSHPIEEIDVTLADGSSVAVLFKDLSPDARLAGARRAKPAFLEDPVREPATYQVVLAGEQLGTAACYGAVSDPDRDRHWLFLERVPGVELYQVGDVGVWEEVAAWLARFHARFGAEADAVAAEAPLLRHDRAAVLGWAERAARRHPVLAPVAARYEPVADRLTQLPATVVHGECYAANVLVAGPHDASRVCPVDWEMAAVGPALVDLAALMTGWDAAVRDRLVKRYRDEVAAAGVPVAPAGNDAFGEALDLCALQLAVQWLGWSDGWQPPPEHARDWLADALRLASRLGV